MNKDRTIIVGIIALIALTVFLAFSGIDLRGQNTESVEGETMQIESGDYARYIFVGTDNEQYIVDKIDEYFQMNETDENSSQNFGIEKYENVYIVEVPEAVDFDTYHNLIGWLGGMSYENDNPRYCVGIAYHKSNDDLGYMCAIENINPGDTLVGQMRDGRIMTVYLPEAYEENITFRSDDYDISALEEYIELMSEDGVLE